MKKPLHCLHVAGFCAVMWLLNTTSAFTAAGPDSEQEDLDYEHWVARFSNEHYFERKTNDPRNPNATVAFAAVVVAKREKRALTRAEKIFYPDSEYADSGCQVWTNGEVVTFQGTFGGGRPSLSPEDTSRLATLLQELPGDGGQLPPYNRRLLVKAADGATMQVRVYDRANLPDRLLAALRLTHSYVQSWSPTFKPEFHWKIPESYNPRIFADPQDDQRFISVGRHNYSGRIQSWDSVTGKLIRKIAQPPDFEAQAISLSPDGTLAASDHGLWTECFVFDARTWKQVARLYEPEIGDRSPGLSDPHFSPDGKMLYCRSTEHKLAVFDTTHWKRLATPPDLPPSAFVYIPAAKSPRAVSLNSDLRLTLWDTDHRREAAFLDKIADLQQVVFSPDESCFAAITIEEGETHNIPRLRVWKTETGELVNEYWMRETNAEDCDWIRCLNWTSDGTYLLAQSDALWCYPGIRLWNVRTGRERAEFTCGSKLLSAAVLDHGRRFAASDDDGEIHVWNLEAVLQKISAFENSFVQQAAVTPKTDH